MATKLVGMAISVKTFTKQLKDYFSCYVHLAKDQKLYNSIILGNFFPSSFFTISSKDIKQIDVQIICLCEGNSGQQIEHLIWNDFFPSKSIYVDLE